jgi:rubredoxin
MLIHKPLIDTKKTGCVSLERILKIMAEPKEMCQCQVANCGYIYNPDKGDRKGKVSKGTQHRELPDDWKCPVCGATKKSFKPLG